MSKQRCNWCGDPATTNVTVDNYKSRLCDNCTAEVETDFTTAEVSRIE